MHHDVPAHKNRQESVNMRCSFDLHIEHRYVKKKKKPLCITLLFLRVRNTAKKIINIQKCLPQLN